MNETESGVLESQVERMKSVDRDFEPKEYSRIMWILAYFLLAAGGIVLSIKILDEIHHRGSIFHTAIQIITLPLIYICPLLLSFRFRKYTRDALMENLISERVANNCEFFIGQQLMVIYMAIMSFTIWN
ncbi:MAG: hypothetical protein WCF54_00060 [Terracidiphilus sp.]